MVNLGWMWGRFGVRLGSIWGRFAVNLRSIWGDDPRAVWGHPPGSIWGQLWVGAGGNLGSIWCRSPEDPSAVLGRSSAGMKPRQVEGVSQACVCKTRRSLIGLCQACGSALGALRKEAGRSSRPWPAQCTGRGSRQCRSCVASAGDHRRPTTFSEWFQAPSWLVGGTSAWLAAGLCLAHR